MHSFVTYTCHHATLDYLSEATKYINVLQFPQLSSVVSKSHISMSFKNRLECPARMKIRQYVTYHYLSSTAVPPPGEIKSVRVHKKVLSSLGAFLTTCDPDKTVLHPLVTLQSWLYAPNTVFTP